MKRLAATAAVLVLLFSVLYCSAAEKELYITYTPRSENSSVFYIDVYCEDEVTAAVLELRFDDSMVSFRDVAAVNDTATVRDHVEAGSVTVAFADSTAVSGDMCRLSFKALQAGDVTFTLHMEQAATRNDVLLPQMNDDTLTVRLGKADVSAADSKTNPIKSVSSGASSNSRHSELSYPDENAVDKVLPQGGVFDLRENSGVKYMLLGAGIVILVAALVLIGVIIGRRTVPAKQQKKEEPPSSETEEE